MRYSEISAFQKCPYSYKLQYLDNLEVVEEFDPSNALVIGTALHRGCETEDVDRMLQEYYDYFPIRTDLVEHEAIKLSALLPKVLELTTDWDKKHEYHFKRNKFHGTVDLIVDNHDGTVNIYDYKYSNNVDNYLKTAQLHIYKYFLELEGFKVDKLGFIFIPKVQIRQKKTETLYEFRERLKEELDNVKPQIIHVDYDYSKVKQYSELAQQIRKTTHFLPTPNKLCDWCKYNRLCQKGDNSMIILKNDDAKATNKIVMWAYGAPFSGKTTLATKFPKPLILNTDGNVRFLKGIDYVPIKDEVKVEGRITHRKPAWEVFKEVVDYLEKKQNSYQTVVVDLLEDVYEHCRVAMYQKLGIKHESDAGFGKGYDMISTEFLTLIKRLINLDYENLILISHEDKSKDFTRGSGEKLTSISPNLKEKLAAKLSGMVDIVGRVVAEGDTRYIEFKPSEVVFGGGRLKFRTTRLPLEYTALADAYQLAQAVDLKRNV